MRGKPVDDPDRIFCLGSIPACAGETYVRQRRRPHDMVYPRVCGGNSSGRPGRNVTRGLSPRVRGKRVHELIDISQLRSIPACAGETTAAAAASARARVYPRVCGGNGAPPVQPPWGWGLSPRVRGKPADSALDGAIAMSIPACAGETGRRPTRVQRQRVYPRVCGGNLLLIDTLTPAFGLSPRVRGKRRLRWGWCRPMGSIPACAGETYIYDVHADCGQVYPRVCGGNPAVTASSAVNKGLSPRVRGKPVIFDMVSAGWGSIPACAGETRRRIRWVRRVRVYPRVCGGNWPAPPTAAPRRGLSPRVRGKPAANALYAETRGSIPACAGETMQR